MLTLPPKSIKTSILYQKQNEVTEMLEGIEINKEIYWEDAPLEAIYSIGDEDNSIGKEGVIPSYTSHPKFSDKSLYSNSDRIKETAKILFDQAGNQLTTLEEKILSYQDEAKASAIQESKDYEEGKIDFPFPFEDYVSAEDRAKACKEFVSEEYREKIGQNGVHSVEVIDSYRYFALVKVLTGLQEMVNTGELVPEVVGQKFHDVYQGVE